LLAYELLRVLHIVSAMLLFGTGLGIAYFFWMGLRSGSDEAALFAARTTVRADVVFTTTAVVLQPLTGGLLIWLTGADPLQGWLLASIALYLLAGACWLPVVLIQLKIRDQLAGKVAGGPHDPALIRRLRRWWFALGWPAFISVLLILYLMIAKPAW
jgi:uncharacterized membrane protein